MAPTPRFPSQLILATLLAFRPALLVLRADEWRESHELILPPGAPPLGEMPAPEADFLPAPGPGGQAAWLQTQRAWRTETLRALHYHGEIYDAPGQQWSSRTFTQDQAAIWDRALYDPAKRRFTVDRFLQSVEPRLGHLDSVLIWQVYPNVGIDDRNQADLLRDLPGGLPAVRELVEDFHRHGTRVLFPYLVWTETTREPSPDPAAEYVSLLGSVGADGINFDTLDDVPAAFPRATRQTGVTLVLEPQFAPKPAALQESTLSWNDWVTWDGLTVPAVPRVSRAKWLEPRHQVLVTDRYARSKVDSLHHAFFNGEGYALLENLWGFWTGFSAWDAEAVLRFTSIERAVAPLLSSPDWEPYAPMLHAGVFASRFSLRGETLWTIVNRNEYDLDGAQLEVPAVPGARYYDLWHGRELKPEPRGDHASLGFPLDSLGFGAVLATGSGAPLPPVSSLVAAMAARGASNLDSLSRAWVPAAQHLVPIAPTRPAAAAPAGMVRIRGGTYDFAVKGIEIESANDPGVDVQFPWESSARRYHRRQMEVGDFFIDRTPVTNAAFHAFVDATGYHPADDHNFLRAWTGRTFAPGTADEPVTWVSLEDARAYASWAGKRLPHDWEWQYAAQSGGATLYPWGNAWDPARVPATDHGPAMRRPTAVEAFPSGATPAGVLDLVGNVYQWTDEFVDDHTRSAILRGAGHYYPAGSIWYFPRSYRLDEHQKYLLMSPGRDRSGAIGFRCVVDAAPAR